MVIFGVLTALSETPKIASFYAPPNALGSTLDFGIFGALHRWSGVALDMAGAALFAAVFLSLVLN